MKKSEQNISQCFLPNFCGLRMVFVVVVIAQLFAFVVLLLGLVLWGIDAALIWFGSKTFHRGRLIARL